MISKICNCGKEVLFSNPEINEKGNWATQECECGLKVKKLLTKDEKEEIKTIILNNPPIPEPEKITDKIDFKNLDFQKPKQLSITKNENNKGKVFKEIETTEINGKLVANYDSSKQAIPLTEITKKKKLFGFFS